MCPRRIGKRRVGTVTNCDLWQELEGLWNAKPSGHLTLKWVKGHANFKHVARGITTELDAWGNLCADRRACEAADQAAQDAEQNPHALGGAAAAPTTTAPQIDEKIANEKRAKELERLQKLHQQQAAGASSARASQLQQNASLA